MNAKIQKGRLLISLVDKGEKTVNGIIVPSFGEKHKEGVVKIGGEEVKKGDFVKFNVDGVKLKIDDKEYLLIREADVLYYY